MTLVEAPRVRDRQPQLAKFLEHDIERLVGALEYRGIGTIEGKALFAQQLARRMGFGNASLGEVNVRPAGETVLTVPDGFTVAQQNDLVHGRKQFDAMQKRVSYTISLILTRR